MQLLRQTLAPCLVGLILGTTALHAQEPPCGVSSVKQTTPLVYPPIARAAHVSGLVILRADFAKDGTVNKAEVWRGPKLLQTVSQKFVEGLRANSYGGSRTCILSIEFRVKESALKDSKSDQLTYGEKREQIDPLHYILEYWLSPLVSEAAAK